MFKSKNKVRKTFQSINNKMYIIQAVAWPQVQKLSPLTAKNSLMTVNSIILAEGSEDGRVQ